MPLFNVLIIVFCAWLLLLAITGMIEHMRLRRGEHRAGLHAPALVGRRRSKA